jgi:DNA repair exonuclease SbcCD ATPase subunit
MTESEDTQDSIVDTMSIARDVSIEYRKKFLQDSVPDSKTVKSDITRISSLTGKNQNVLVNSDHQNSAAPVKELPVCVDAVPEEKSTPITNTFHDKIRAMDTGIVNHEKKLEQQETRLGLLNGSLASVMQSLNTNDKEFVKFRNKQKEIENNVKDLQTCIDDIRGSIARNDSTLKLNKRLQKLDKELDSLRQDHDELHRTTYETFSALDEQWNEGTSSPEYDAMCEPVQQSSPYVKRNARQGKNKRS